MRGFAIAALHVSCSLLKALSVIASDVHEFFFFWLLPRVEDITVIHPLITIHISAFLITFSG